MEIVKIKKANALLAFESATNKQKTLLSNLFGKSIFQKSAMERIKSYEDACYDIGIEPLNASDFMFLPERDRKHAFASHKLTIIIQALNEGWVPNWSNSSEYKYYGYFRYSGSGSGFSDGDSYCVNVCSAVGSRLVFKSRELAEFAGKQFISIYNDYLTL